MIILLLNLVGVLLIVAIVWWFWLFKPKAKTTATGAIDVIVDGGVYTPAMIQVQSGQQLIVNFMRKDQSPCAQYVVFSELGISEELPINQAKPVVIPTDKPGEFEFTCQMGMYRGKLIIL